LAKARQLRGTSLSLTLALEQVPISLTLTLEQVPISLTLTLEQVPIPDLGLEPAQRPPAHVVRTVVGGQARETVGLGVEVTEDCLHTHTHTHTHTRTHTQPGIDSLPP
jgi:hypothetical protein